MICLIYTESGKILKTGKIRVDLCTYGSAHSHDAHSHDETIKYFESTEHLKYNFLIIDIWILDNTIKCPNYLIITRICSLRNLTKFSKIKRLQRLHTVKRH